MQSLNLKSTYRSLPINKMARIRKTLLKLTYLMCVQPSYCKIIGFYGFWGEINYFSSVEVYCVENTER